MKRHPLLISALSIAVFTFHGCTSNETDAVAPAALEGAVVEAACGECQFGLEGPGCDLAVRLDGEAYFVDGTSIDEHGDAHAADGFCNAIRHARVTGTIEDGRLKATGFELLPVSDD